MKTKRLKRSTEITMETTEYVLARKPAQAIHLWCAECAAEMVRPEEAARLAGVSTRTIYRWVESERVHFAEDSVGGLLVCLSSLKSGARKGTEDKNETGEQHGFS